MICPRCKVKMMDKYWYFRDHDGISGWGVQGSDNFKFTTPTLGKLDALIVAKLLSKQYQEALDALEEMKIYNFYGQIPLTDD